MKKFFKEFKDFISRGNVVDLAVAVIIGGAFSAIVTAFTNKIIMPIVNLVLSLGGDGLSSAYTFLKKVYLEDGTIDLDNSIFIDWGAFVTAIIDFIIIAFVVFCIVKFINASAKKIKQLEDNVNSIEKKELKAIRRTAKKQAKLEGKDFNDVYNKLVAERNVKLEEEAKEKAEKEAAEKLANPSQEELLKEIRDLLKAKK